MAAPIANPMAHTDGSMTFDWIFFVIVVGPMLFAVWELLKTNESLKRMSLEQK